MTVTTKPVSRPAPTRSGLSSLDRPKPKVIQERSATLPSRGEALLARREGWTVVWTLLAVSLLAKALIALAVTHFVLVDDAYIHLRYAQNAVQFGELAYNPGEAVFGLTSPSYSLLTVMLTALGGGFIEQLVTFVNIGLWTTCAWILSRNLQLNARLFSVVIFLFWPSFVDNQMLGMETALFVLLLVSALRDAVDGRTQRSALAYGLALITRPEAILLVPSLLFACASAKGVRRVLPSLARPKVLLALLGPGIAWCTFALLRYGSVIPQSMIAKNGWSSEHYDSLFSWSSVALAFPRLTFLPFIDYFPGMVVALGTLAIFGLVCAVAWANWKRGTTASRAWLLFYAFYMAFYVLGKGATEASWYSIPSSVALLLAAEPLWPRMRTRYRLRVALVGASALLACSAVMARQRAPLLQSYVDGYGRSAEVVNELEPERSRVLIGEIGVYGFMSDHDLVDVGALVSPEVLPMKNAGYSLFRMVKESEAEYFVISQRALDSNFYPSVGKVWADEAEERWFETNCTLVAEFLDKRTFRVD